MNHFFLGFGAPFGPYPAPFQSLKYHLYGLNSQREWVSYINSLFRMD